MSVATAREWSLRYEAKPVTLNAERKAHWAKRAASTAEWRQAFHWLAKEQRIPALSLVTIDVLVECRTNQRPDPGAHWPAVKAAQDGIVDAGVVPTDTSAHVLWLRMWRPETTGTDSLTLIVREVEA